MSEQRRAFLSWRRHLEEVIGVDDASVVDDEIATKSWIREEFQRQDERLMARLETMIHRELKSATWRWMGLMVAQTGVFVALVPLLT